LPVYDYACTTCGHTVEVTHAVHAHGPSTCEICGGPMRKLLSAPAIVFKGSGWAKKDAQAAGRARGSRKGVGGTSSAAAGETGGSTGVGGGTAAGGGEAGGSGAD
jgi:putative FmdB family regulatory protein